MFNFTALPTEIQMCVIGYLDFPTLISLASTSHYFYRLDLKPQKRVALFDLERQAPGTPKPAFLTQLLIRHTHLPCYHCLRFLNPAIYFDPDQIVGVRALGQHQASRRRCVRCQSHRNGLQKSKSVLVFRNGLTYIECVRCKEVKRYTLNDLHEQAWARGQSCSECWWFRTATSQSGAEPVATDAEWIRFDSKCLVRVPVMDGKTAAMLIGEISLRTPKKKSPEFKKAMMAIKAAVKLPNIRVIEAGVEAAPNGPRP